MRIGLLIAGAVLWPAPALAMNWEGHADDWVYDIPYARALEAAIPQARPLPSPDCPVTGEQSKANPYEQIPLPRHNCPRPPPEMKKR